MYLTVPYPPSHAPTGTIPISTQGFNTTVKENLCQIQTR